MGSDTDPGTTADTNLYSGSNYSIRIVDLYGAGSIESDWFTITGGVTPGPTVTPVHTPSPTPITPPPTPRPTPVKIITVNRPRLGETVTTGFSSSIEWNSENVAGPVRITLKNHWEPGQTWNVIASTPDDGYFDWEVDYQILPESEYFIVITSIDDPSVSGQGAFFGIVDPSPKPDPGMGDVDRDGFVSFGDLRMVVRYLNARMFPDFIRNTRM